jgi:hypothetical protein
MLAARSSSAGRSSGENDSSVDTRSVPSVTVLAGRSRPSRATVLRFLVVDDNELNKSMFERTINSMFEKQDRTKPVYTFAANGL